MADVQVVAETSTQRVVVAFDATPSSESALVWAIREAAMRHAELQIIHVKQSALEGDLKAEREFLARFVDDTCASSGIERASVQTRFQAAFGQPIPWILAAADDADLLVVGSQHHSQLGELFLGSVSRCLCVYSKCPVVVVHAENSRE